MKEKKQNQKTNKSTEKKEAVSEGLLDEELMETVSGGRGPTIEPIIPPRPQR